MTPVSKTVYIAKLDDIVNKSNENITAQLK